MIRQSIQLGDCQIVTTHLSFGESVNSMGLTCGLWHEMSRHLPGSKTRWELAGEEQCKLCKKAFNEGDLHGACKAASRAWESFLQARDWVRAAMVGRERLRIALILLSEGRERVEEVEQILLRTVELHLRAGNTDLALELLATTGGKLVDEDPEMAAEFLRMAVQLAELEGRAKQAEVHRRRLERLTGEKLITRETSEGVDIMLSENFGKKERGLGINVDKSMAPPHMAAGPLEAMGTLMPLGAAIYSGAVGIAACRPSFIGLTPGQFREFRKQEWDRTETETEEHLEDEGASLV